MSSRFRSFALLLSTLAACASAPTPLSAQAPPVAGVHDPVVVVAATPSPATLDSVFRATYPDAARSFDSLRTSNASRVALLTYNRRLNAIERRQHDRFHEDSLDRAMIRSGVFVHEVATPRAVRHRQLLRELGLTIASGAAGYGAGALDHDPGGYPDSYRFTTDKAAHAFGSATFGLATGHLPACLAFGGLYELGQRRRGGYGSRQDFAWDAIGCGAGAAWRHFLLARER